jgi:hypothetical protein
MRFGLLVALLLASSAQAQVKVEEDTVPVIHAVPVTGRLVAVDQTQHLNGSEFDLFVLSGVQGPVTWDVSSPNSTSIPIKIFELAPKTVVVGYRVGHTLPGPHVSPDAPSVAVFATGSGRAVIAAWIVKDGKPFKIATLLVDANNGPQPPPAPPKPPEPVDPPTPKPVPPEPPAPVTASVVTAVIIEDSLKRTPATAALVADLTYLNGLAPTVETVHIVPAASAIAKQYDAQVKEAGGIPAVIIMDFKTKKVLAAEKLPADKVAFSALINRVTGKK